MFMIATPLAPCAGLIGQINAIWHMVLGFKGYKWLEWLITQQQQGTFADLGGFTLMYNSMAWFSSSTLPCLASTCVDAAALFTFAWPLYLLHWQEVEDFQMKGVDSEDRTHCREPPELQGLSNISRATPLLSKGTRRKLAVSA